MKYLCLILLLLLPFEMKAQTIIDSAEVVMSSSIDIKHQKKLYKQTKYRLEAPKISARKSKKNKYI